MSSSKPNLARRLGLFDATMIVMGGIIGAGIFKNPSEVAGHVHTHGMILAAWAVGGLFALLCAFIYAELAAIRPAAGGQYSYLRDAYHPMLAFLYGWTLLLVTQTGGMAAVAVIFAKYFLTLIPLGIPAPALAVLLLLVLTIINCFGVRAGSNTQSVLMITKLLAIMILIATGLFLVTPSSVSVVVAQNPVPERWWDFAIALIPVMFAYGGAQTASFVSGEMKNPKRDLPLGLLIGVGAVIVAYLAVNEACLRTLGVDGLAATDTPATDIMRLAMGEKGAQLIAIGIIVSTAGFLSQGMLTAPRVYYEMARDGVFFKWVGWLHPKTQAPVVAIALQGVCAAVIAACVDYGNILNFVVGVDQLFFGLTAAALLVFRARMRSSGTVEQAFIKVPGNPVTTAIFAASCMALSIVTVVHYYRSAGIGAGILLAGVAVFPFWQSRKVDASPNAG